MLKSMKIMQCNVTMLKRRLKVLSIQNTATCFVKREIVRADATVLEDTLHISRVLVWINLLRLSRVSHYTVRGGERLFILMNMA